MKKLTKLMIGLLIVLQPGCSKDDHGGAVQEGGSFTLDGTAYTLSKGFLEKNKSGGLTIRLTSSGISLESSSDGDDFIGTGDFVFLIVITSSGTSLDPGTFVWSNTGGPSTIEFAEVGVNLDVSGKVLDALEGTGGTATVSISGNTYTIAFTIMIDTKTITGSYIGPLTDVRD